MANKQNKKDMRGYVEDLVKQGKGPDYIADVCDEEIRRTAGYTPADRALLRYYVSKAYDSPEEYADIAPQSIRSEVGTFASRLNGTSLLMNAVLAEFWKHESEIAADYIADVCRTVAEARTAEGQGVRSGNRRPAARNGKR